MDLNLHGIAAAPSQARPAGDPVRVMVVDDSALIRGAITRTLEAASDIQVVATASDGAVAISTLQKTVVDVIVLDIEMPRMDGLTAIPRLLEIARSVKIIMASTLTLKNADVSLKALAAGAADYVPKPTSIRDVVGAPDFARDLIEKVRHLGAAARRSGSRHRAPTPGPGPATGAPAPPRTVAPVAKASPQLRPMSLLAPRVIAFGSSTGGPEALFQVLKPFATPCRQPIVLTQHMPPSFTTILAEHLTRRCGIRAVEATEGMVLEPGRLHLAPGNFHMTIVAQPGQQPRIALNQEPAENYCRPAVDPMLRSLVTVYGPAILAVILTGMGQDGLHGCEAVVRAGGSVIAQDEATSVVWGMPGAVANAGVCSAILPVSEIGPRVHQLALRAA